MNKKKAMKKFLAATLISSFATGATVYASYPSTTYNMKYSPLSQEMESLKSDDIEEDTAEEEELSADD